MGMRVGRELDHLVTERGRPRMIVSDNGSEFTSNAILAWADQNKVEWRYIAPGKRMQNAFVAWSAGSITSSRRSTPPVRKPRRLA